jgi:hypothetical protein
LILIGLAHAGMWALAGGSASGAVSWRKPTSFGLSLACGNLINPHQHGRLGGEGRR